MNLECLSPNIFIIALRKPMSGIYFLFLSRVGNYRGCPANSIEDDKPVQPVIGYIGAIAGNAYHLSSLGHKHASLSPIG